MPTGRELDPEGYRKYRRERNRKRRLTNPHYWREKQVKKYGIDWKEYQNMWKAQGGVCRICGENNEREGILHVDHDHITGKIRALLCKHCNQMLGHARDNVRILRRAVRYLELYGTAEPR